MSSAVQPSALPSPRLAALALCVMVFGALASEVARATEPLVVYSARNEQLIKPLFESFFGYIVLFIALVLNISGVAIMLKIIKIEV